MGVSESRGRTQAGPKRDQSRKNGGKAWCAVGAMLGLSPSFPIPCLFACGEAACSFVLPKKLADRSIEGPSRYRDAGEFPASGPTVLHQSWTGVQARSSGQAEHGTLRHTRLWLCRQLHPGSSRDLCLRGVEAIDARQATPQRGYVRPTILLT